MDPIVALAIRVVGELSWDIRTSTPPFMIGSPERREKIGPKRPLKPRDIWAIRSYLHEHKRLRYRAQFDLAIDSKLRGCNLVKIRVGDLMSAGSFRDRATVIQAEVMLQPSVATFKLLHQGDRKRHAKRRTAPRSAPRSRPQMPGIHRIRLRSVSASLAGDALTDGKLIVPAVCVASIGSRKLA